MPPCDPKHDLEKATGPQNETDQNRDVTPGPSEVVPEIPPTSAYTNSPSGKERQPRWLKVLEVIVALAIPVYAIFSGLQWYIMQSSMKLDQRAWLGTTVVQGTLDAGKPVLVSVGLKNTGKTPAKNVTNTMWHQTIKKNDPFVFPEPKEDLGTKSKSLMSPQQEGFIQGTAYKAWQESARDNLINEVASGVIVFYIYGTVNYDDIFKKGHWLNFCYFYDSDNKAYKACSEHNDTDND